MKLKARKEKKLSIILWVAITSGILFGIFNLISALVKNYQLDNVHMEALPCMGYKPKNDESPEAKQYLGSMNRAQQAKFAEIGAFANSVDTLGIGIRSETTSFIYSINVANKAAFHYGLSKNEKLKSYVGAVFLVPNNNVTPEAGQHEMETVSILCVAKSSGMAKPANPTNINGQLACGNGTEIVTK